MFEFVFKMFAEGSATLPAKGMRAVGDQLARTAEEKGAEVRYEAAVLSVAERKESGEQGTGYTVECEEGGQKKTYTASSVVVATSGPAAVDLLFSSSPSLNLLPSSVKSPPAPTLTRSVGCVYYSLKPSATLPVTEPILVLNGMSSSSKSTPVNNLCFPSVVSNTYAPPGHHLASVTILSKALDSFRPSPGAPVDEAALDKAVREHLARDFFPNLSDEILSSSTWTFLKVYDLPKAVPAQFSTPSPANSDSPNNTELSGVPLPPGLLVAGDHTATATLNGAIDSGTKAAELLRDYYSLESLLRAS